MSSDSEFEFVVEKGFNKSIEKNLPQVFKKTLDQKLKLFKSNPFHPSLNSKKYNVSSNTLKRLAVDSVYEFYINRKEFRVLLYIRESEKQIILAFVGTHDDSKRKMRGI